MSNSLPPYCCRQVLRDLASQGGWDAERQLDLTIDFLDFGGLAEKYRTFLLQQLDAEDEFDHEETKVSLQDLGAVREFIFGSYPELEPFFAMCRARVSEIGN